MMVINTIMGMAIDAETRRPVIGNVRGGLSGPAIKPIALLKVHEVHEVAAPHRVPIIGQGGIRTAKDALEFIIAGATAVGVGTALFYDPLACRKINSGIADYLERHGEGFFHMAVEVADVGIAARALRDREVTLVNHEPRIGVDGWKLVDIEPAETMGAMIQLVEDPGGE